MYVAQENTRHFIEQYFYDIAEPQFYTLPDRGAISQDGYHSIACWDLPGVRLTRLQSGSGESKYMRFQGLGQKIGMLELALIGVHPHEQYPDLVIASGYRQHEFVIVPSEVRHQARKRRSIIVPKGADKPALPSAANAWLSVGLDKYNPGIYQTLGSTVNVAKAMPSTVEACLSVAQFLVAEERGLKGFLNNPEA